MNRTIFLFIFLIIIFVSFGAKSGSSSNSNTANLTLCITTSCYAYGNKWEGALIDYNSGQNTGITSDYIAPGDCGVVTVTNLPEGTYYWSICANPPYWCCWGEPFHYDGNDQTYNFVCSGNCIQNDKIKNN